MPHAVIKGHMGVRAIDRGSQEAPPLAESRFLDIDIPEAFDSREARLPHLLVIFC